ncbi:MAG: orotate phosphoribosyltransferase [Planctomycetes bacterium]|nr:orotate phosphoribosyltransferase [Planctomycetota bacterium]
MKKPEIKKLFYRLKAVQSGHFLLTSGLHSNTYVQCARVLEQPRVLARLAGQMVRPWSSRRQSKIDVVAAPAVGGIIMAYEVARILNARAIYLERVGTMVLRRGFTVKPGERVLVVEDVVTTGGSVKEVVRVIKKLRARVMGVAALVNRGKANRTHLAGVKLNTLLQISPPLYDKRNCPFCRTGKIPLVKPGSRKLK